MSVVGLSYVLDLFLKRFFTFKKMLDFKKDVYRILSVVKSFVGFVNAVFFVITIFRHLLVPIKVFDSSLVHVSNTSFMAPRYR